MNFWVGLIGGSLIGLAAVWLFLSLGRIAGISGIATNALMRGRQEIWPVLFVIGLGAGGWIAYALIGERPSMPMNTELAVVLMVAGVLVGFGTRLGSGCTSGHGVCGLARLSVRSLAATATFVAVGMLVATGRALL